MVGCPIDDGVTFSIISPLFEHNHNLRKFAIADVEFDARSSQLLVSALANCYERSMRSISLVCSGMDDDSAEKLVSILGGFLNLRRLDLYFSRSINGKKWSIALGELLQKSKSKLTSLDLSCNDIINERAVALGGARTKQRTEEVNNEIYEYGTVRLGSLI